MGTSTIVYTSLVNTVNPATTTCSGMGLPSLPAGWIYNYNCPTSTQSLRSTDGTGWIPVNFQRISSNSPISQLPIDPTNTTSSGNYYTYITGGSWMLSATPESQKQKEELSDNPHLSKFPGVIGIGNNLEISPLYNSNGLVGYWKFDEGSAVVAKDSSGNGNDGAVTASVVDGRLGRGVGLDGSSSSYVDLGNGNSLGATSSLTISSWVSHNCLTSGDTSRGVVVYKGNFTAQNGNYLLRIHDNNRYLFGVNNGTWRVLTSSATVPPNTWHFLVGTWDGQVVRVYLDGVMDANTLAYSSAIVPNSIDARIGASADGSTNIQPTSYYRGIIDDVRIYNRALSAAEISALYNATK